jgi:hypothetical protein
MNKHCQGFDAAAAQQIYLRKSIEVASYYVRHLALNIRDDGDVATLANILRRQNWTCDSSTIGENAAKSSSSSSSSSSSKNEKTT